MTVKNPLSFPNPKHSTEAKAYFILKQESKLELQSRLKWSASVAFFVMQGWCH